MGLRDDLAIEEARLTLAQAQDRLNFLQGKGRYAPENWPLVRIPTGIFSLGRGIPRPPPAPAPVLAADIEAAEKLLKKAHVHD